MRLTKVDKKHYKFLYKLLEDRDPIQNISHEHMPTFEAHCRFLDNKPYKYDWVIEDKELMGRVYVTYRNEIGIVIDKAHQNKGVGTNVINQLKQTLGSPLYANVAPKNLRSQRFFEREGFKQIQHTYKW